MTADSSFWQGLLQCAFTVQSHGTCFISHLLWRLNNQSLHRGSTKGVHRQPKGNGCLSTVRFRAAGLQLPGLPNINKKSSFLNILVGIAWTHKDSLNPIENWRRKGMKRTDCSYFGWLVGWLVSFCFIFETGSHYETLAVLELKRPACLCLPSSGVWGACHHCSSFNTLSI